MGRLTTHVLDLAAGGPAAGVVIALERLDPPAEIPVAAGVTNADGRLDGPLLEGPALLVGRYQLAFEVGDYFRRRDVPLTDPAFLDTVVIRFAIADPDQHYHVPLLAAPYGYSTYRGS